MPDFFERLNYSFGNEDWRTEQQALKIQPQDTVLCITASGDRPLHLLLDECKEIVSIDANPIQNYLLSLKCAALEKFDFLTYLNFLEGYGACKDPQMLAQLFEQMDGDAASFWKQNPQMIKKGVLFQGRIECLLRVVSRGFRCLRPRKIKRLFEFEDLEEQKAFLLSHWDTRFLKTLFGVALNQSLPKMFFNDPGLFAHVDSSIQVGHYIYDRMLHRLHSCLANQNAFVSLLFQGFLKREAYPPYLTESGSNVIKKRLNRLKIKTENVIDYLASAPANTFDAYSLSDIASYMPEESFNELISQVVRTAKPGARFCIRQFSSNHPLPQGLANHFERDLKLEKKLEEEDSFFVYRFMTGKISPRAFSAA
ncbi:MAG: hypothetical protein CK425_01340 [Parachlamydia sp.]|nr:MAG: hypothetical protein CK425_01340 [Parachlamydia sp.]